MAELLRQLDGREALDAWTTLLERVSHLLLQIAERRTWDEDEKADCFVYLCQQLSRDRYRRLRRYRADCGASFETWLRVVARRLSIDWLRQRLGSHRTFHGIAELPAFDQEVFQLVFEQGLAPRDAAEMLTPTYPNARDGALDKALVRIDHKLRTGHRWRLSVRALRNRGPLPLSSTEPQLAALGDDAEDDLVQADLERRLATLVSELPPEDRLLIRLRYEHALSLREIAELLELGNPQRADRHIRAVVQQLRTRLLEQPSP